MLVSGFTLGIEEEFQSIDSQTGELRSSIVPLLEKGQNIFGEKLHTELVQSMIELTTDICPDIIAARSELQQMREQLVQIMQPEGLFPISAGTHPFSSWREQDLTDKPRYHQLAQEYQDVFRQRVLFGLHIHVGGVTDKEMQLQVLNQLRTWLPHLLALSTNSPFWEGRQTGLKSYRSIVWQSSLPRSGLSDVMPSQAVFNRYIEDLVAMQCIRSAKDIWWYIRPHLVYDTIEFRICDMPATLDETLGLVALCQALVVKLAWLYERGQILTPLPRTYIEENLWKAMRYGLDADFLDFVQRRNLSLRDSIHEMLDFVDDVVDDLGSRHEIDMLRTLVDDPRGSGADRQIAAYEQREDWQDVIDLLKAETLKGRTLLDDKTPSVLFS